MMRVLCAAIALPIMPVVFAGEVRADEKPAKPVKRTDRIIEVTEKNRGKDVPAKLAGSEFLYLVDDLEERMSPGKAKPVESRPNIRR